jgi:hypothetical protein
VSAHSQNNKIARRSFVQGATGLLVFAPLVAVSTTANADTGAFSIPSVLIDALPPWPRTLVNPMKRISLGIHVPGAPEFLSAEAQVRVEHVCAGFLAEKVREVSSDIAVVAKSNLTSEADHRDPSTVWADYEVWLVRWQDTESGRETVLGAAMLSIHAQMDNVDAPSFVPGLFQSKLEPDAVAAAVQESVNRHATGAIVAPIKASVQ